MTNNSPSPLWLPTPDIIEKTHLYQIIQELNLPDYLALHRWSIDHPEQFWEWIIKKLNIQFNIPYEKILDLKNGIEHPIWLPGAGFNIINSCFQAPKTKIAITYQAENKSIETITYGQLEDKVNQVANGLKKLNFQPGDRIALIMPLTPLCIATYLGIIKFGCQAVSIAESFSADEIKTRLNITKTKAIITQDYFLRGGKKISLYDKISPLTNNPIIVIPESGELINISRQSDIVWNQFLGDQTPYPAYLAQPNEYINLLFSSGTTGDPKVIPWTQTTPLKCASDGYFHQDIHESDTVAWPTSIGWMMGPWLIFATLLNRATIALYNGLPTSNEFGQFIQHTSVTILGVVPSLVKQWRQSTVMEKSNWSNIRLFTSTAECSNQEDMAYLMNLAGNKPIIEYCGGTEIGGAYITSTLIQPNAPSTFTTPALGIDFILMDEEGKSTDNGEVALIPPSMGLSNELVNFDHHKIYFAGMPKYSNGKILRRHGDQLQQYANGYYRALGRADDTMKLGGIKVSSAEIERVILLLPEMTEVAAIAVTPIQGGPTELVIFAVTAHESDVSILKKTMQKQLNEKLNPLFKIADLVLLPHLPRTASNKIMRRVLRDQYQQSLKS